MGYIDKADGCCGFVGSLRMLPQQRLNESEEEIANGVLVNLVACKVSVFHTSPAWLTSMQVLLATINHDA